MKTKNVNSIGFRNTTLNNVGDNLIGLGLGAAGIGYLLITIAQSWFYCKDDTDSKGTEQIKNLYNIMQNAADKSKKD